MTRPSQRLIGIKGDRTFIHARRHSAVGRSCTPVMHAVILGPSMLLQWSHRRSLWAPERWVQLLRMMGRRSAVTVVTVGTTAPVQVGTGLGIRYGQDRGRML